jgi:hypothetical protein
LDAQTEPDHRRGAVKKQRTSGEKPVWKAPEIIAAAHLTAIVGSGTNKGSKSTGKEAPYWGEENPWD